MNEIPGGRGAAAKLRAGEAVDLVNTHGTQVVDTWCLAAEDTSEYLSVEHTRRMLGRLFPRPGDGFYSNRRNILLRLELDTSACSHDMLIACCDRWLYAHYGCPPGHRSCADNFIEALAPLGVRPDRIPNPVNLWMNVPVEGNDRIELRPPQSKRGDRLRLRAVVDCYVIFSACPMDITLVNGEDRTPKSVHYEIVS